MLPGIGLTIAVLVTAFSELPAVQSEICTTTVCDTVAEALRVSINSSLKPCDDFFSYVCLGWLKRDRSFGDGKPSIVGTVVRVTEASKIVLKKALYKFARLYRSDIEWAKLRESEVQVTTFFSSCLHSYGANNSASSRSTLRKLFHSVNLEYFDEEPDPKISAFSVLLDVAIRYDLNPLFSLYYKPGVIGFKRLYVPNFFESTSRVSQNLTAFWKPHLMQFAKNTSNDQAIMNKLSAVFEAFEIPLERNKLLRIGRNHYAIKNATKDLFVTYDTSDMQTFELWTKSTKFPWYETMSEHVMNLAKLDKKKHKLLVHTEFYESLANLSNDVDTMQMFKDFIAVELLISQMGKSFNGRAYRTLCAYQKCYQSNIDVDERCTSLTTTEFPWSSVAIVTRLMQSRYSVKTVRYFFSFMKVILIKKLEDLLDGKTAPLMSVLGNLTTLRDKASFHARFDRFETTEHRVKLSNTDLLANMLMLRAAREARKFGALAYPFHRQGNLYASTDFLYAPAYDDIFLPEDQLVYPNHVEGLPFYLNLASLGWTLGHEIGHALEKYIASIPVSAVAPEEKLETFKSAKFRAARKCLARQFKIPGSMSGYLFVSEVLSDNLGFTLILLSYKALKKLHPNEPLLSDIHGLTRKQLFFVSNTMMFCVASTNITLDPFRKHPPAHFRINRGLSNLDEFATAFGCKPTDPMVAQTPCNL